MKTKNCGCPDDDRSSCPRCEGWSQAELDAQDARKKARERARQGRKERDAALRSIGLQSYRVGGQTLWE